MHVDASPHQHSPLSSHLPPWADLHSVVAFCIRLPGTLGIVHVHLCKVLLFTKLNLPIATGGLCCYTTITLATPGPTTTVHHYAQRLSPKAWLTFKSFVAPWHNPIVPRLVQHAARAELLRVMQRTELCKGSTPDDKCSTQHGLNSSSSTTKSSCVLSTSHV